MFSYKSCCTTAYLQKPILHVLIIRHIWAPYGESTEEAFLLILYQNNFYIVCTTVTSLYVFVLFPKANLCALKPRPGMSQQELCVSLLMENTCSDITGLGEHAFNSALKCRKHNHSPLLKREQSNIHFFKSVA